MIFNGLCGPPPTPAQVADYQRVMQAQESHARRIVKPKIKVFFACVKMRLLIIFWPMDKNIALEIVGGLSTPSKMPCHGYSIPAKKCITGAKLRGVTGSICSKCYALKGRYVFSNVQNALQRRFDTLQNKQWVEAMAFLLNKVEKSGFFRWHDSGDLQSVEHLENIVKVCNLTPSIQHWLPTREFSIVSEYLKSNSFPQNLTVRLSALMLEGAPPVSIARRLGLTTSGVSKSSFTCPAPSQAGKCGDCRACWDKSVSNVNYKQH